MKLNIKEIKFTKPVSTKIRDINIITNIRYHKDFRTAVRCADLVKIIVVL
jgi:hypothetical protein